MCKEIILSRDEFVELLAERVDDVSEIGKSLRFVENVFSLQNDAHRPAYLFSVTQEISTEDMEVLRQAFIVMGVVGVFVPSDLMRMVKYEGTITKESLVCE